VPKFDKHFSLVFEEKRLTLLFENNSITWNVLEIVSFAISLH